ncbi:MAG: hypothetical protein H7Y00_00620, partial [Fimbriimonadaceae bacterium]|nr:hypothetical protein [Chitinophagales bacterium]
MRSFLLLLVYAALLSAAGCKKTGQENKTEKTAEETDSNFTWQTEQFADLGILRYKINGWDKLTLKQKEFV